MIDYSKTKWGMLLADPNTRVPNTTFTTTILYSRNLELGTGMTLFTYLNTVLLTSLLEICFDVYLLHFEVLLSRYYCNDASRSLNLSPWVVDLLNDVFFYLKLVCTTTIHDS